MTRPRVSALFVLAAGLLWLSASLGAQRAARPIAREKSLYVSVVDQNGAPVPDLGPSDFLVKEDNVTREVLHVEPATEPMQIAVLVDTSTAARNEITYLRQGLPEFVMMLTKPTASGRKNQMALIGIGERHTVLVDYSTDPIQINKGVNRIWSAPQSGMYLLDSIVEEAQRLKKREAQRPVLVSITTSGIEYSNRMHDQALEPLKATGAAYYALVLGQPDTSLAQEARERAIVLDQGPRDTGGYQEQILASMALPARLKVLGNQLTHQYKVTYGRPESLIPPEKTTVAAVKPGLVARGTPIKEETSR